VKRRWVKRRRHLQLVGEVRAPLGLAAAEGRVLERVRVRQVVDAGEQRPTERRSVRRDAPH
jgi:hypothetical protein